MAFLQFLAFSGFTKDLLSGVMWTASLPSAEPPASCQLQSRPLSLTQSSPGSPLPRGTQGPETKVMLRGLVQLGGDSLPSVPSWSSLFGG